MDGNKAERARESRFIANGDQFAWTVCRIADAIKMALVLNSARSQVPAANERAFRGAIAGIAEEQAVEIIQTLGGEVEEREPKIDIGY